MKLSDFDFEFDEDLIALRPVSPRSSSRLLVQDGDSRTHTVTSSLPEFLRAGDLLVLNDTKVIPARIFGTRTRGDIVAKVDLTLTGDDGDGVWRALARPARKLAVGDRVEFGTALSGTVTEKRDDGQVVVRFDQRGPDFHAALAEVGFMPLPPYVAAKRPADAADRDTYQTVFARNDGAIAAPTASLHFDAPLLEAIRAAGVHIVFVTLHVGIGTFLPVKVDDVADHKMHAEWGEVSAEAADKINDARAKGGRIIPVGTTALRLIETAARADGTMVPWTGDTDIFITPGYRFRVADGLMTNFHLPKSTLMMLVSALMGMETIRDLYADAIARRYRFFSYGDASLLFPAARKAGQERGDERP